jgi:hypothetical protein
MSEKQPDKPILPKLEDHLLKVNQSLKDEDIVKARDLLNDTLQRHYGLRVESVRNEDGSISDYTIGES